MVPARRPRPERRAAASRARSRPPCGRSTAPAHRARRGHRVSGARAPHRSARARPGRRARTAPAVLPCGEARRGRRQRARVAGTGSGRGRGTRAESPPRPARARDGACACPGALTARAMVGPSIWGPGGLQTRLRAQVRSKQGTDPRWTGVLLSGTTRRAGLRSGGATARISCIRRITPGTARPSLAWEQLPGSPANLIARENVTRVSIKQMISVRARAIADTCGNTISYDAYDTHDTFIPEIVTGNSRSSTFGVLNAIDCRVP